MVMYSASKAAKQSPVRPPTRGSHKCREESRCARCTSIDGLLQLLYGQDAHSLGCWLGLEDTWLLGERFIPLRAGVAGFFFNFMFNMPANLKALFFFNCSEATPMMPSTTPFTCFGFRPTVSATEE